MSQSAESLSWASSWSRSRATIVTIPSPEQRVVGLLATRASNASEIAEECRLPRRRVYSILGSLYERRAIRTHPSGYFWVGPEELLFDRLFPWGSDESTEAPENLLPDFKTA